MVSKYVHSHALIITNMLMNTAFFFYISKNETLVFEFLESSQSFSNEEFFVQALSFVIIPFFVITVIILVITLLINHYINLDILDRKSNVIETTDTLLTQLLFWRGSFDEMKQTVAEFKYTVPYKKKWCRKLIMERVLQMKQNFQLDSTTLLDIYKLFEFDKITYNLIRNKKWHKRSLGIYQLQFVHDISKKRQLDLLLEEKNPQVKSNALITLVTFSPERFGILSEYEHPLNKADEIKLMDIIYHSAHKMPKSTSQLLKSKNTSIIILGIKLMVLYKAKLSMYQINKLIRFSNFRVRKEAIKAVGKLNLIDANEILVSQYRIEQHKKVKINILISLKKIGNEKTLEFLKTLIVSERDEDIKFKIVESILNLKPILFEEENHSDIFYSEEIQSMARHVKDPLLV